MVAVVSGSGLGLVNASNITLGAAGQVGQGLLGQAGGRSFVNASTGNLILQFGDERLSGKGIDLAALRTYNAMGGVTDGDGDGWRWDGEASVMLTSGTLGQPGSTVSRTTGDGHVAVYSWNAANSRYESFEGAGAVDTLKYASGEWTWTDGSSQTVEKYDSSGKIQSRADAIGNLIIFGYSGNKLTSIKDNASGQELVFNYENGRVSRIDTRELNEGSLTQQVYYGYDSYGRLETVKTDLSPEDNSILTGRVYTTTYAYDGTSFRVQSISQSDGEAGANSHVYVSYTYDASFRIKTVTDASGTQTFNYYPASGDTLANTTVTNELNQVWIYSYDANGQLKQVQTPAVDGQVIITQYSYDADGNVSQIIDGRGNSIVYQYDASGNRKLERDALGNTVTRTYDANNQLSTETRYRVRDPDGLGSALPGDPLTTRYTYDSKSRLRFVVTAEGRVTEYRYNAAGNQTETIQYTNSVYSTSALGIEDTITESQLDAWGGTQDKTKVQLSKLVYDYRGNLDKKIDYATTNSSGAGVVDNATTITHYVYDAHGQLKNTIAVRGATRTETVDLSVVAYDGLGRLRSVIDASGSSTTVYESVNGADGSRYKINITNSATGLTTSQAFDTRGRLISVSQTATGETGRTTQYVYNAAGNLAMLQDASGNRSYTFYDAAGRVQFSVSATGKVTEYKYNKNNQVTDQIEYTKLATTTSWFNGTAVTKTTLTTGATGTVDVRTDATNDRTIRFDYDEAGRLVTRTDAAGNSTTTRYNGASEVTQVQSGSRVTRYYYDQDGRQVGVLDALGYLTENKFDAAGRLVRTIRYYSRSPAAPLSQPIWTGAVNQTLLLGTPFSYTIPAAVDPNGLSLTYSVYGGLPSWASFDPASLTISGTPVSLEPATITLRVINSDGATADLVFTLTGVDNAPNWQALADRSQSVNSAVNITLPAAVDPDGHSVSYSILGLPAGLVFDANSRKISGILSSPGVYTVTANATDIYGVATTKTFTFTVTNAAPTWGALSNWTQPVNSPVNITLPAAVDPEGQELTYSVSNLPPGLSFNPESREISGVLTGPGTYTVTVRATDPNSVFTNQAFTFTVTNSAPVWAAATPPPAKVGTTYTYTVPIATDAESQVITYSAVSLPTGFTFNAATRVLSGPIGNISGSLPVILKASDANGLASNLSFSIAITNEVPVYQSGVPNQTAKTAHNFSYTVPANAFADANNDTLVYTAFWVQEVPSSGGSESGGGGGSSTQFNPLPSWLNFNAATRTFSGTPSIAGSHTIEVRATDPSGAVATRQFVVTVNNQAAPVKGTTLSNGLFTYGTAGNYTLPAGAFTDADGDALTYSAVWEQSVYQGTNGEGVAIYAPVSYPLPSGLTIDIATGTISSNGSVPASTYTIIIKATDPAGTSATSNLTLVVNSAPTVGAGALPNAVATSGSPFTYLIPTNAFSDDQGLTYTVSGLPAGLSLNGNLISGTPTATGGSFPVIITATDPFGLSKPRTFTLVVNSAPVYQAGSINNQTAKTAHGFNYTIPVNAFTDANNDTLTYTAFWVQEVPNSGGSESGGGGGSSTQFNPLPSWLNFNAATRTFSGTPSIAGSHTIEVRATDPSGAVATRQFVVTVNNQAAPVKGTTLSNGLFTYGTAGNYTLPAGAFTDADGDALTYSAVWEQSVYQGTNGEGVAIYAPVSYPLPSGLTIDSATGTISSNGSVPASTYTIIIKATDPAGTSATSNLTLVVNSAPTVGAGALPNAMARSGSPFSYPIPSNAFSDDQGVSYAASGLPAGLSLNGNLISGTPTVAGGNYTVVITGTDPYGLSSTRSFIISVNAAPVYQSGITNQTAKTAHGFNYTVPANAFTDANNDTLTYTAFWVQEVPNSGGSESGGGGSSTQFNPLPSWLNFNAATRTFSGTPSIAGSHTIEVRATDPSGAVATRQFVLTVNNQVAPVKGTTLSNGLFTYGTAGNYTLPAGAFTDADGDALTYSAVWEQSVYQGTNGEGVAIYAPVSYPLPSGLTIDSATGTISSNGSVPASTYTIIIKATDPAGTSATSNLTLVVNSAPTVGAGAMPNITASIGSSFYYFVPANAFNDDQGLTYSASGMPAGITFNSATRTFNGVASGSVGNYTVTVTAVDPYGLSQSRSFTIGVVVANVAPVYQYNISSQSATIGRPINFTLPSNAFTDANGDALTYTAFWVQQVSSGGGSESGGTTPQDTALPYWLSFNPGTRTFSGTPPTTGIFAIKVRATDPSGLSAIAEFNISVAAQSAPVYQGGISNQTARKNSAFSYQFSATAFTDANGDPLTYTAEWGQQVSSGGGGGESGGGSTTTQYGALPAWLSFNASTRTFSGTPPSSANTSYNIRIRATDVGGSNQSVTVNFSISVLAALAASGSPSFNIANLANGANVTAIAGEVNPYVDVLASIRPTSTANDVSTWYYYDGQGRVTGAVDEKGFLTETIYDEANNTRRTNQYTGTVAPTASSTLSNLTSAAGSVQGNLLNYDLKGQLVKQTAFDGTTTNYEYDSAGRLVRTLVGAGQTEIDGTSSQRGSRTRYNAFGEVVGVVSGVGEATLAANPTDAAVKAAVTTYGVAKQYDVLGRTIQTTDASGNRTLYYYDGDSRLRFTVSALGDVSEYRYSAFGQVESSINYNKRLSDIGVNVASLNGGSAADLAANVTSLADSSKDQKITSVYNTRGLLDKQIDAEGFRTSYLYNSFGELESDTQVLNISANITVTNQYSYNNLGKLIQSINDLGGLGLTTKTFYDAFGRTSTVIDARGKATSYSYVSSDGNNGGRTITVTDPLLRTNKTEYDAFDRTLKVYDGFNKETVYSYTDANRSFTVKTPEGITVTTYKTRSGEIAKVTDDKGGSIKYQYNANGQLKKVTDALNKVTIDNVYKENGNLWKTTDALGTVVELGYDALNRVISRTVDPTGLNLKTTYEFNALGQQFRVTEAPGTVVERVTEYTYDRKGQLSTVVTDPAGLMLQTTYTYDGAGNAVTVAKGTTTTPNQQVIKYIFDKAGRRISEIVDPVNAQNLTGLNINTTYRYDANGNVSRKIDANSNSTWYIYDDANQLKFTVNALGGVTGNTYDANGRLASVTQYFNTVSTTGFGNEVKSLGAIGNASKDRTTVYVYDNDGRLKKTIEDQYSAKNPTGLSITTENYYDKNGNVTRTTDANNNSTWYIYDANNRQTQSIDMLGYVTYSQYDDAGNLIQTTRYSNPVTINTSAQAIASVSPVASTDPAAPDRTTGYVYDKAGRQRFTIDSLGYLSETIYNQLGQVAEQRRYSDAVKVLSSTSRTESALQTLRGTTNTLADSVTRGESYTYDKAGRLKTTTDAKGETETYGYDAFGNRTSLTNKNLKTWTYVYDKANRLTDEITPEVAVASIDAAGVVTTVIQAITTHNDYDGLGNVRFRTEAYGTSSARVTEYQYDKLGRQTVTLLPGYYDPAAGTVQATQVTGSFIRTVRVTYDSLGNAVQNTIKVGAGASDVIYQTKVYDKVGRVAYEVDALNQVTGYTYDAMGNQKTITRYARPAMSPSGTLYEIGSAIVSPNASTDRVINIEYDVLGRKKSVSQTAVGGNYYPDKLAASNSQASTSGVSGTPKTTYEYNAFDEVVRESVQVNSTEWAKTYHYYNSLGQKTVDIDALGFYTAYGYDAFGNLSSQVEYTNPVSNTDLATLGAVITGIIGLPPLPTPHGNDRSTSYLYNELNQRTDIIRANLSYYNTNGTDANNNIKYVAASGSVTTWKGEYDKVGNLTNQYDAAGNKSTTLYDELGRTQGSIDVARNAAGRTTGVGAAGNDPFLNQVTAATPTISYALDAFGAVISETRTSGGAKGVEQGETLVVTHRYDLAGNEIATTDALGNTVFKQYDVGSHLIKETQSVSASFVGWAAGNYTDTLEKRYVYDLTGRQIASLEVYTDSNDTKQQTGKVSTYNAFGDIDAEYLVWGAASENVNALRTAITGSGFNSAITASYSYDKAGRVTTRVAQDGTTKYLYDLAGHNTRVEQQGNKVITDGTGTRVTETVYDLLGRATSQRGPQFNALNVAADTLAMVNQATTLVNPKTSQEYDRWGNITKRTDAAGSYTTYTYNADNKVITEVFSGTSNLTHEIHYDKLGRSVEDVQKNNGTETRKRRSEYNQAGQLIASVDGTNVRTEYAYDGFGNQIANRNGVGTVTVDAFDANGNQLRRSVLRNSTTGSVNTTADYYVSVGSTQSNLNLTGKEVVLQSYQYDQAGRRIADGKMSTSTTGMQPVWVPNPTTEGGSYQSQLVTSITPGNANYYSYDERNNVIGTRNPTGITKTTEFNFANQKVKEIDGNNTAMSWEYSTANDYTVGQLNSHTDLGNHTTTYTYNDFGQTKTETLAGRTRTFGYTENGLLKSMSETWTQAYHNNARNGSPSGSSFDSTHTLTDVTSYDYNINGQQVRSTLQHTRVGEVPDDVRTGPDGESTYYLSTKILNDVYAYTTNSAYDKLGRLTQVSNPDGGQVSDSGVINSVNTLGNLTYTYDEFGNRLQVSARYTPLGGTEATQVQNYKYDNEGRITNANGMIIDYDKAGRRWHTETVGNNQYADPYNESTPTGVSSYQNLYKYTDTGQIQSISGGTLSHATNFSLTAITAGQHALLSVKDSRQYDGQGYMTYQKANNTETTSVFKLDGRMESQTVKVNGKTSGITTYTNYDGAGNLTKYNYQVYNNKGEYQYSLTYTNEYGVAGKFDSYKQTGQTAESSQNGSTPGQTTFTYDFRGYLIATSATGSNGFSRMFTNNMLGQIVSKREYPSSGTSWQQSYVYVNGNQVAQLGKDNQFDMGVTGATGNSGSTLSITNDIASTSGQYVVNSSDSLFSIAQAVWGDSSQWYLIADANGINLAPDAALTNYVGQNLRLPNVARSEHNNATTFKPYNPQEIIGDTTPSPTPPPPPKKSCNALAMIAIIVVAIVVTVFTAGAAAMAMAGTLQGAGMGAIMTAGSTALVGGTAAATAAGLSTVATGISATMAAGAAFVGGVVGSAASQMVGVATGQQEHFSLRQAFSSGITTAATAGLGGMAASSNVGWAKSAANYMGGNGWQNHLARGAFNYTSSQVANRIAGVDTSFSWKGMAASAVGNMAGQAIGGELPLGKLNTESFAWGSVAQGIISGAATGKLNQQWNRGGKVDFAQIAIDAFGNVAAQSLVSAMTPKPNIDREKVAELIANGGEELEALLHEPELRNVSQKSGGSADPAAAKLLLTKNAIDAADLATAIMENDDAWNTVRSSLLKDGAESPYARFVLGVNTQLRGELNSLQLVTSTANGRELAVASAARASQVSMIYSNALDAHLTGDASGLSDLESLVYNRYSQQELVDSVTFNVGGSASSIQLHGALTATGLSTTRNALALTRNTDALAGAIAGLGLVTLGGSSSLAGFASRLFTSAGIVAGAPESAKAISNIPSAIFTVKDIDAQLSRAQEAITNGATTLKNPILREVFEDVTFLNAKALSAGATAVNQLLGKLPLNKYAKPLTSGMSHDKVTELATMMSAMEFKGLGVFSEVTTMFSGNNGVPMMQNGSNHGIDLMARYKNGDWVSFEVKSSLSSTPGTLSKQTATGRPGQNAGADVFTRDRLAFNANQRFQWKDPFRALLGQDSRSQTASTILQQMRGKPFDGYVVSFTHTGQTNMKVNTRNW